MQFTYCPQCGSMDFAQGANGLTCRKCHYAGQFPEGSMDKINEIRKRAPRAGGHTANPSPTTANAASAKELAERLKALKGKSTEDAEFL